MAARGCGASRESGGLYLELLTSPGGRPVEYFFLDPVQRVPQHLIDSKSIKQRGLNWLLQDGVHHIIDWIGERHYPNAADYIEEVRHLGISRHIGEHEPLHLLSPRSRHIIIHPRAHLYTASLMAEACREPYWSCPKRLTDHVPGRAAFDGSKSCAGLIYEMVSRGLPLSADSSEPQIEGLSGPVAEGNIVVGHGDHLRCYKRDDPRLVTRTMPSFEYVARSTPKGLPSHVQVPKIDPKTEQPMVGKDGQPVLQTVTNIGPGYLASFPIGRLAVVAGDGSRDKAERVRKRTSVEVAEVDE